MRKFVQWPDGDKRELSPITFGEWSILAEEFWTGSDDMAYARWLRVHDFIELSELDGIDSENCNRRENTSEDIPPEFKIVLEEGDKELKFDIDYS